MPTDENNLANDPRNASLGLSAADYRALSLRFREGLARCALKPVLTLAGHILCQMSLDLDRCGVALDLSALAEDLGLRDAKSLRPGKAMPVLEELIKLGIVDHNSGQGTFEPRPNWRGWSRLIPLRRDASLDVISAASATTPELQLRAERPLSEALSDLAREEVLTGGPVSTRDWPALFTRAAGLAIAGDDEGAQALLREHFAAARADRQNSPVTLPAKFAGKLPANFAGDTKAQETPMKSGQTAAPANFAGNPGGVGGELAIASLASVPVQAKLAKAELASLPANFAGELEGRAAAAWRWLESVDIRIALKGRFGPAWEELCCRNPDYVLRKLRGALEDAQGRAERREKGADGRRLVPIAEPLAWLSRKARDDGELR